MSMSRQNHAFVLLASCIASMHASAISKILLRISVATADDAHQLMHVCSTFGTFKQDKRMTTLTGLRMLSAAVAHALDHVLKMQRSLHTNEATIRRL